MSTGNARDEIFATYDERMPMDDEMVRENERFMSYIFHQQYSGFMKNIRGGVSSVLEIGCYKGLMAKAVLEDYPEAHYTGVDLSPHDIAFARKHNPDPRAEFRCDDAFRTMAEKQYDVIIAKAVMEHIRKEDQKTFVQAIYNGLRPGGMAIVSVPNMDWLFASHERYMDFTHEMGYTRESLFDIFRLSFGPGNVEVVPGKGVFPHSLKSEFALRYVRPWVIRAIRFCLKFLGEYASDVWFEYRSIVAVAVKPS